MRRSALFVLVTVALAATPAAADPFYVEYYRDDLFAGIAYHRVACLTNWTTIQSNQDYDGFTTNRYCFTGATANSVPNAEWFDWNHAPGGTVASAKAGLDNAGTQTNTCYATPNYAARSTVCSYNVTTDCNSDCWMENFSSRQGHTVSTVSPCFGSPPVGSVNGISCNK